MLWFWRTIPAINGARAGGGPADPAFFGLLDFGQAAGRDGHAYAGGGAPSEAEMPVQDFGPGEQSLAVAVEDDAALDEDRATVGECRHRLVVAIDDQRRDA